MNRNFQKTGLVLGLSLVLAATTLTSFVLGKTVPQPLQDGAAAQDSQAPSASQADAEAAEKALKAERARLKLRLRLLRRSEAGMGANHPSLQAAKAEIIAVQKRLDAPLQKESGAVDANDLPGPQVISAAPEKGEVHRLLSQMSAKVERLEKRVNTLERLMQVQ